MVALFVVPAFCTKSGYIYKNKGGGQLNQNQTKSKLQLSSARKVIQVQITLLGSKMVNRRFVRMDVLSGRHFVRTALDVLSGRTCLRRFVRKTFCQDRLRRFVRKTFCQDRLTGGHILGISLAFLGHILGISWAYLRHISGISWAYIGHILGIS